MVNSTFTYKTNSQQFYYNLSTKQIRNNFSKQYKGLYGQGCECGSERFEMADSWNILTVYV